MAIAYTWANTEETLLIAEDETSRSYIPADPANRNYAEFLSSGATAAAYVEPPAPPEPTTEEKVNRLLTDYGLTRDEMRVALAAKS